MRNKQQASARRIKPPLLPKQAEKLLLLEEALEDRTVYNQQKLVRQNLVDRHMYNVTFDQVVCEQVEMSKAHFKQVRFLDSCLKECNLANGEMPESEWTRVEMRNCQLTGLSVNEGRFQDVLFKDCLLSFAQFGFTALRPVCFEDCDLSDANFYQADLTGALFIRCNLQRADFSGARLLGADLRGSQIDGIRLSSLDLLKGAYVDQEQALAIIKGFGVNVEFLS